MEYYWILLCVVLLFIAIGIVLFFIERNRPFNVEDISLKKKWLKYYLKKYATKTVEKRYRNSGKKIATKKGVYTANFLRDVQKEKEQIIKECFHNGVFNKEICNYVKNNYEKPKVKDFNEIISNYRKNRIIELEMKKESFLDGLEYINPKLFFDIKKTQIGDVVGVYIIHNKIKEMYYVGQAKKLFFRVNQHFTGHGNGDIYADYKYGDKFEIKIVKLSESGYDDLDLLEKDLIKKYDAYESGYNKTHGNK